MEGGPFQNFKNGPPCYLSNYHTIVIFPITKELHRDSELCARSLGMIARNESYFEITDSWINKNYSPL